MSAHFSPEELAFLERVAQIVKVNPFGEERAQLDRELMGLAGVTAGEGERFEQLAVALFLKVQAFEQSGKYNLSLYEGERRQMLFMVLLFDVFLRFKGPFLGLIAAQKSEPGAVQVPFAQEALGYLLSHGATELEAYEILAYSYQVHRAYHFIDDSLVGRSPSMIQLRGELWNNVFTHNVWWYRRLHRKLDAFSTLLLGETGTGKGAAAEAIGYSSFIPFEPLEGCFASSYKEQFITLNLSEFPEGLIESELFGHRKGAFTGALQGYDGILSRGQPFGCIFLDEIGDLSLHLQVKLLQVIQHRLFSPVGSHDVRPLHGRLLSATHRSIEDLIEQGLFREDFYYRICTNEIHMPPLRQRIAESSQELEELVSLIIERIVGEPDQEMAGYVLEQLTKHPGLGYDWPGNVRELEQRTRRILLSGASTTQAVPIAAGGLLERLITGIKSGTYEARELLRDYTLLLYEEAGSYNEVARITGLDRRTVKKHIDGA